VKQLPRNRKLLSILIIVAITSLMISCGGNFAVGLIESEGIKPGEIYKVKSKSFKKIGYSTIEFYQLAEGKNSISAQATFVEPFNSKKDALKFAKQYEELKNIYAKATSNHKIRPTNSPRTATHYRMQKNQTVKVIRKLPEEVTIDGIKGFWYEVLTEDGYRGFSFDYRLEVFNKGKIIKNSGEKENFNRLIEMLANKFYPEEYLEMINEGRIDLSKLNNEYGFSLNLESESIQFRTNRFNILFAMGTIKELSQNRFFIEDKKLNITIVNEYKLRVTFNYKNGEYDFNLIMIKDILDVIEKEKKAREGIYSTILKSGPTFKSSSYGTLTFNNNRTFTWENYDRLVPGLIPASSGTRGRISFNIFMPQNLASRYDDALTFKFGNWNSNKNVSFFITVSDNSIKLRSIPQILINEDGVIKRENSSPIIIYFQSANSQ